MEHVGVINLKHDDHTIPVKITHSDVFISPHSGRELRQIEGTVQNSSEELHDWFMQVLKQQAIEGILLPDTPVEQARWWNVKLRQWTQSGSRYSYTVEIREIEPLDIQELIVDQVHLQPYRYKEDAQDGLRIDVKVELSKDDNEQFLKIWANGGYFSVIRRGIQDEPREMRFGSVYWSEHVEKFKYDFVLVERTTADEAPRHPWDLPGANARVYLAFEIALRRNLFDLLLKKGIISDEEIIVLKEKAKIEADKIEMEFHRVSDVDLLP